MRTTIDLPDAVFREAKAVAARRGVSLKELFLGALERELGEMPRAARTDLPVIPRDRTGGIGSYTNAEIDRMLDAQ